MVNLKSTAIIFLLVLKMTISLAQGTAEHHYLVLFEDKVLSYVQLKDSAEFLTPKSLDRRKKYGISLDSTDLPVPKAYVENIKEEGVSIRYATKWLNGAVISVSNHDAARRLKIKFFVKQVVYLGSNAKSQTQQRSIDKLGTAFPKIDEPEFSGSATDRFGASYDQLQMLVLPERHLNGFEGQGVNIAVFDAGFKKVDRLSAFKHLFDENRLRLSVDLINFDDDVYEDDAHGLHVLGCLAANDPGKYVGSAPKANYFLFRTESSGFESLLEELNWIRAAEMADSLGVDLINSSLGYTTFDNDESNHTHDDLDGVSSWIAKGANFALAKGIFIVNSAGNDGNKSWRKLDTPADVEGVLTIGAVDKSGELALFSSHGPSRDGRIKPDVCAWGYQTKIVSTYGGIYTGNGTSYSSPIMCGFVASLMQEFPNKSSREIFDAVRFSSNKFHSPDTLYGYGIPNAQFASFALGKTLSDVKSAKLIGPEPTASKGIQSISVYNPNVSDIQFRCYEKRLFLFVPYKKSLVDMGFESMGKISRIEWEMPEGKKKRVFIRVRHGAALDKTWVLERETPTDASTP